MPVVNQLFAGWLGMFTSRNFSFPKVSAVLREKGPGPQQAFGHPWVVGEENVLGELDTAEPIRVSRQSHLPPSSCVPSRFSRV